MSDKDIDYPQTVLSKPPKERNFDEVSFYTWKSTERNTEYETGLVLLPNHTAIRHNDKHFPNRERVELTLDDIRVNKALSRLRKRKPRRVSFESCLLHNNSDKKIPQLLNEYHVVERFPRYKTELDNVRINTRTGDITSTIHSTDSFKQANHRKIKALDKFCDYYQPMYRKNKVSLFHLAFSGYGDQSETTIAPLLEAIVKRLKNNGHKVLGYIWTLEVSEGLHRHYHMCLATDRIKIRGKSMPKCFYFNELWGARTEVTFVREDVKRYLSKYFAKDNFRIQSHRSFGNSLKHQPPTLSRKNGSN